MKIGLICGTYGVHERRFAAAFRAAGHEVLPLPEKDAADDAMRESFLLELAAGRGLLFGGPLAVCAPFASPGRRVPLIAVSYAFDVLLQAIEDAAKAGIMKTVLAFADGLVADCHTVREACLRLAGRSTIPTACVPWGLDGSAAEPRFRTSGGNGPCRFISLRNFTPIHGVADTLHAFASITSHLPSSRLLLAGSGEREAALRRLADELGIASRVDFLGSVSESGVPDLLRSADIYVSSSRVDGVSISMLQAMDAGLPLILSDVGGNQELSRHDGPVWKFPSGNVAAFAQAMLQCAGHRQETADPWREFLMRRADWQANQATIVRLCESTAAAFWSRKARSQ